MQFNLVFLGVGLEILATIVGAAGKQLIRYGERGKETGNRAFTCLGVCCDSIIGPLLDISAYAFAPQAMIAPFNGLDVCWTLLSAPFALGEPVTWKHIVGTLCVALGASFTALFGPGRKDADTVEELLEKLLSKRVGVYVASFVGLLIVSILYLWHGPKDRLRSFLLPAVAGGIAGNMIFVSCTMGLVHSCIATGDWVAFTTPLPYILIVCAVGVALSNIPFKITALGEYEAVYVVTIFEGTHIVVACVSSSVVLREMELLPINREIEYWCSLLLICMGLFVIQSTSSGKKPDQERQAFFANCYSGLVLFTPEGQDRLAASRKKDLLLDVDDPAVRSTMMKRPHTFAPLSS